MPGGEMMKGLVDAIANCRLYRAESGDSAQPMAHNTATSGGKKSILILIIALILSASHLYAVKSTTCNCKYLEMKDTSILKGLIINTVANYIDSLKFIRGVKNETNEVYVVRIEDTIPPNNQCYFSLSFIMMRSEFYDVKPTHYFLVNDKVVLVRCKNYPLGEKIGLNEITSEAKEKALKILLDDSVLYYYWCYTNSYYFFEYTNDVLKTTLKRGPKEYEFLYWLNNNNIKKLYQQN